MALTPEEIKEIQDLRLHDNFNGHYRSGAGIMKKMILDVLAKAATPDSREEGKGDKHVGSNQYCSCGDPSCERFAPVSDAVEQEGQECTSDGHGEIGYYAGIRFQYCVGCKKVWQ